MRFLALSSGQAEDPPGNVRDRFAENGSGFEVPENSGQAGFQAVF